MRKVLIIDDEEDFCYFMKRNLERAGDFQVAVCSESTKSIEQVEQFRPDAVLLDIMMPGISGSDIAAELQDRDDTKHIPIIFITAMVTDSEVEQRKNLIGGKYFFAKPIRIKDVVEAINEVAPAK